MTVLEELEKEVKYMKMWQRLGYIIFMFASSLNFWFWLHCGKIDILVQFKNISYSDIFALHLLFFFFMWFKKETEDLLK